MHFDKYGGNMGDGLRLGRLQRRIIIDNEDGDLDEDTSVRRLDAGAEDYITDDAV